MHLLRNFYIKKFLGAGTFYPQKLLLVKSLYWLQNRPEQVLQQKSDIPLPGLPSAVGSLQWNENCSRETAEVELDLESI